MHRQGKPARPMSSASRLRSPPTPAPRAASSSCMPRRCPAIRMMDTRCAPRSRTRRRNRARDRACLCRQRIPRPRCAKPTPCLHLRPEARRVRRHQARAATPLSYRARDRPYESRGPSRPLLSQGNRRRCRQRHPHRRRPQPATRPRLAEDFFVPDPGRSYGAR